MITEKMHVTPIVMSWAREQSGYSIEEVAQRIKVKPETLQEWEAGLSGPTYSQLENLAYKVYKRPVALFFLPQPPSISQVMKSFRKIQTTGEIGFLADTCFAIRESEVMQLYLNEINNNKNDSEKLIFKQITLSADENIKKVAKKIRDYLKLDIDKIKKTRRYDDAFNYYRNIIQDNGIYVFKRSFKQKDISGLCLHDDVFPIIYVNSSNSYSRQIFTIMHELTHLLIGSGAISTNEKSWLFNNNIGEEVYCNKVASEVLLPSDEFEKYKNTDFYEENNYENIAFVFKVSREVILRKALDLDFIEDSDYKDFVTKWGHTPKGEASAVSGHGNYYNNHISYLGKKYVIKAFNAFYSGKCTFERLGEYLRTKPANIGSIENRVAHWR